MNVVFQEQLDLINLLKKEFGNFPKEVFTILNKNRCFYLTGMAALDEASCDLMLNSAGADGEAIGVKLILKRMTKTIREKGEGYYLSKLSSNATPLALRQVPPAAKCSVSNAELSSLLQQNVKNFLGTFKEFRNIAKTDVCVTVRSENVPINGSVLCQFCQAGMYISPSKI
jgi:hypothetical protein